MCRVIIYEFFLSCVKYCYIIEKMQDIAVFILSWRFYFPCPERLNVRTMTKENTIAHSQITGMPSPVFGDVRFAGDALEGSSFEPSSG